MNNTNRPISYGAEELLNLYFPVLDGNSFISLVDYMGNDESIEQAARVSYGAGTRKTNETRGLLRYLHRRQHCYTPEMEVLTDRGWIKWKNCNKYENFLVPNPQTKKIQIENLQIKSFDYSGELHCFNSNRISYTVTPEHKMWFKGKYQKEFTSVQVNEMLKWGYFERSSEYSQYSLKGYKDPKFEFIGFFLGDGCFMNTNRISFHFTKERKKQYLEYLKKELNLEIEKTISGTHPETGHIYYVTTPTFIKLFLEENLKHRAKSKQIDFNKIPNLDDSQLRGLLHGLINSDGSIKKGREQTEYSSTSIKLINLFELLCAKFGIDAHQSIKNGNGVYNTTAYFGKTTTLEARKKHFNKKQYDGKVFCTTTSTGLLIVRGNYNEFGFICGNSTPREMIELKFHVCCPIFVMRQWCRTRMANTNEHSGRFSLMPMLFYTPNTDQFRLQSKTNKQGRSDEKTNHDMYKAAIERWNQIRKETVKLYEDLTEADVARELARIDLPLSTLTQFYWKIDLHNLFRFLTLRTDNHAQWEIQEFAKIIAGMMQKCTPLSFEAWFDYDVCGTNLSRMELSILQKLIKVGQNQQGKKQICAQHFTNIKEDEMPELSLREIKELFEKLKPKQLPVFDLNLSQAKPASYFEELIKNATPNIT